MLNDMELTLDPSHSARRSRGPLSATATVAAGLLALLMVLLSGGAAFGQPVTIGDEYDLEIVTPENYAGGSGTAWSATITHQGASYIALHFANFELGDGDSLVVSDASGGQRYTMSGRGKMNAGTFWARHIKGDTVLLSLEVSSDGGLGFQIDSYAAGYPELDFGWGTRAICGADDKDNAICYENSHPIEYDTARSVARLFMNGSSLCTGWLVSDQNHLVTNEHCITSQSTALNTDYEFMAEAPSCGTANCQLCHDGDVYSGGNLLIDNASLDYALVQIASGDPSSLYGHLEVDDRVAIPGEQIYIPQHPGGRAKELGIFSTWPTDGGLCRVASINQPSCTGTPSYQDVGYYCDTEGGSSGSPVIASSSNKVIALHHCANCQNRGVPINLVWDEIEPFLGGGGDFELTSPANGSVQDSAPLFEWEAGSYNLFYFYSVFNYEGIGYYPVAFWVASTSFQMPVAWFNLLADDVPSAWLVVGYNSQTFQSELSDVWTFSKSSNQLITTGNQEPDRRRGLGRRGRKGHRPQRSSE